MVVAPGHDFYSGRSTKRLGIGVGESEAFRSQLIYMGSVIALSSIATKTLDPYIVRHDEDDIGLLSCAAFNKKEAGEV